MTETLFYKNQLEQLIHAMRSPLIILSLASKSLIELSRDNHLMVNPEKKDEYAESLDLIQSTVKNLNGALGEIEKKLAKNSGGDQ